MISGPEQILLAVLVLVLMTGMGAALTPEDFRRIGQQPRGALIGLASQFGWMPLVAFGLARLLELPPEMALGLVLVGCTPGGTTSNLFAYYARADVALSVSMTALSTIVAVVAMPLLLMVYASPFTTAEIRIPYGNIISTLVVVLVPVGVGMTLRARRTALARKVEVVGSYSGIGVLGLLLASSLLRNGSLLLETSPAMYVAAIALGAAGMGLGFAAARLVGLDLGQRRAVALETGIQNSPLAFAIILASFDPSRHMAILWLPLLYALFVLVVASVLTLAFRRSEMQARAPMKLTS